MKTATRFLLLALALAAGCATSYTWKPRVPAALRTVAVPTFQNESDLMELGALSTRQLLREFQREGTFALASPDEAALEVQGVVKSVSMGGVAYSRRQYRSFTAGLLQVTALVSVVDKRNGAVLVDNKPYVVETTMASGHDKTTAERDASGRVADELARRVVDDILNLKW